MSFPSPITALKLRVSTGAPPNVQTFEQPIPSASMNGNSFQITNALLLDAFSQQPAGTQFTPSVIVTYNPGTFPDIFPSGNVLSVPSVSNFIPKQTTPNLYLANIPEKSSTDSPFSLSDFITTNSGGGLSYSSSVPSVATVNSSGEVTPVDAGTTTITVNLAASADGQFTAAGPVSRQFVVLPTWRQRGLNIIGEATGDYSGGSVSLSSNGTTVAIGAMRNSGNGAQSGHVRVCDYSSENNVWTQRGSDIDGEVTGDLSGISVSLSSDGNIVAIGAIGHNNETGTTRVFYWDTTVTPNRWTQRGLRIVGDAYSDHSGCSVSLSSTGNTLAIGARYGNNFKGQARVYDWDITVTPNMWTQRGSNINGDAEDNDFGWSVSLSSQGNTVAVGAPGNNNNRGGTTRIYDWDITNGWTQRGSGINGEVSSDYSGTSVSLSSQGNVVVIGSPYNNDSKGQVRVFYWNTTVTPNQWTQRGSSINGEVGGERSGTSVSVSSDGNIIAIGAPYVNSYTGKTRVFSWNTAVTPNQWTQRGSNLDGARSYIYSGTSVSLSSEGNIVAIGAPYGNDAGNTRVHKYH